jgi:hypothetical protein
MDLVQVKWKPVKTKHPSRPFKFPTVGEMFRYIKDNQIPNDSEIVVEHVQDVYISEMRWSHYRHGSEDSVDGVNIMLPVHNGFGWIEDKKYFALWMHY